MGTLNWQKFDARCDALVAEQKKNLSLILAAIDKLGYQVIETKEVSDGWMTGFTVHQFTCFDRRNGRRDASNRYIIFGNDDNTSIFYQCPSGGKALLKVVSEVA
jgi:hypothetical protein